MPKPIVPRRQNLLRPSRRRFLRGASAVGLVAVAAPAVLRHALAQSHPNGPFGLGVASGAPRSDGFVLWTRLVTDPLSTDLEAPRGVTAAADMPVGYEIATDPEMAKIVRRGSAMAEKNFAFSVHADIGGLEPGAALDRMRFGFVSCSNYEHGYFSAYRHLADEHPDVVLFLGDYIYETIEENRPIVRRHSDGVEAATLPTYRNRYAQYKLDADLQRLHAEALAFVTWDDHEVENDYADKWSAQFEDPQ